MLRNGREYVKLWRFWCEKLVGIGCWKDALTLLRALLLRTSASNKNHKKNFGKSKAKNGSKRKAIPVIKVMIRLYIDDM